MRFKTVALTITASILLSSCYPTLPAVKLEGRKHVSGFDFRPYLNEGFDVSPYDLEGDGEILGDIRIQIHPEIIVCRWDSTYRRYLQKGYIEKRGNYGTSSGGVQIPYRYMIEPIDVRKSLDDLVTIGKQMGGNGLASFRSEYIRTDYGDLFYYYALEVSGLVFKRTEPKRPDQP